MATLSPLEQQHFQRLKINRTAVLQELRVDHVLNSLELNSVLSKPDIKYINEGVSTYEKSKRLLDILPTKGRSSNWYNHFRAALLNPSVDDLTVKHKYQVLVEFLDNTIIGHMKHPIRLQPNVSNNGSVFNAKYKPLPSITHKRSKPKTTGQSVATQSSDSAAGKNTWVARVPAERMSDENEEKISSCESSPIWNLKLLEGKIMYKCTGIANLQLFKVYVGYFVA